MVGLQIPRNTCPARITVALSPARSTVPAGRYRLSLPSVSGTSAHSPFHLGVLACTARDKAQASS